MNIRQIETFFWAARLGSFAKAALRLNATQSAVSMRIQEVESRLNTVFMTSVFLGGAAGSLCGAAAVVWSWSGLAGAGASLAAVALIFHLVASRASR